MSRIAAAFARARDEKRKALIAYVCAGDPSLEATERVVPELARAGADLIELGLPFSDPIADGPVIQAASQRALAAGTTSEKVLDLVRRLRARADVPLVLMGYLNPIVAMGFERFAERAGASGVDGLIVPDLPLEESEALSAQLSARGIDLVLLAAPTTPPDRLARIARATRGFLYVVSVTGVTGGASGAGVERSAGLQAGSLERLLDEARATSPVPVAVGFGISTPEQARVFGAHADAVVVGSALVRELDRSRGDIEPVAALTRKLAASLR